MLPCPTRHLFIYTGKVVVNKQVGDSFCQTHFAKKSATDQRGVYDKSATKQIGHLVCPGLPGPMSLKLRTVRDFIQAW